VDERDVEAKMFSKLMLLSLRQSRIRSFKFPAPLLNPRALEDIWLLADGAQIGPDDASAIDATGLRAFLLRWRKTITGPVAASDAIYSP
jgi:hypothetical protein